MRNHGQRSHPASESPGSSTSLCSGHLTIRRIFGRCSLPTLLRGLSLYPSARRAHPQTVENFVEHMKGLEETSLHTL